MSNPSKSRTIKTRKVWVILYKGVFYDNYKWATPGKTIAKHYLMEMFPKKDGFEIVRAELRYPVKGEGKKG